MRYQQVPFKEFNGHFIKNDVTIPEGGAHLLIENYDAFSHYFGTAYMGAASCYVTPDLFKHYRVLAVLKDYVAIAKARSVVSCGSKLVFTYSMEKITTETWQGHTPVIISVPKEYIGHPHCTEFEFLKQEALVVINNQQDDASESIDKALLGGWSTYHEVSEDERSVFKEGMKKILGVHYVPMLCKCQVVAGMNYQFICLAQGVYPEAKWSLAKVSLFRSLDGKVYCKGIKALGAIENIANIDEHIRNAVATLA